MCECGGEKRRVEDREGEGTVRTYNLSRQIGVSESGRPDVTVSNALGALHGHGDPADTVSYPAFSQLTLAECYRVLGFLQLHSGTRPAAKNSMSAATGPDESWHRASRQDHGLGSVPHLRKLAYPARASSSSQRCTVPIPIPTIPRMSHLATSREMFRVHPRTPRVGAGVRSREVPELVQSLMVSIPVVISG